MKSRIKMKVFHNSPQATKLPVLPTPISFHRLPPKLPFHVLPNQLPLSISSIYPCFPILGLLVSWEEAKGAFMAYISFVCEKCMMAISNMFHLLLEKPGWLVTPKVKRGSKSPGEVLCVTVKG